MTIAGSAVGLEAGQEDGVARGLAGDVLTTDQTRAQ
jgi:hypothetical protein